MAEQPIHDEEHSDEEASSRYVPPAEKSMSTILQTDQEDESLRKYKEALLGANPSDSIMFPEDPRRVIVQKLGVTFEEPNAHAEMIMDLSGPLDKLTKTPFVLKEGVRYRIKIYFYVQREIVTGLKYKHSSYRKGVKVDKTDLMVGSYGPKKELQSYTSPVEDAPSGMLARGTYTIKSLFTDDDKNEHLSWEWVIQIKKDWE